MYSLAVLVLVLGILALILTLGSLLFAVLAHHTGRRWPAITAIVSGWPTGVLALYMFTHGGPRVLSALLIASWFSSGTLSVRVLRRPRES